MVTDNKKLKLRPRNYEKLNFKLILN